MRKVIIMIAILKIDSADFINRLDQEKFQLRMIPSTRIKFDSEDVKFYEPIFYNDVEVIDEPPEPDTDTCIFKSQLPEYFWDYIQNCIATNKFPTEEQLNPDNYLLKSSMPDYYWKFSKYALTKPQGYLPNSRANLCNILQAIPRLLTDEQVYNYAQTPFIFIRTRDNQTRTLPFVDTNMMDGNFDSKTVKELQLNNNYIQSGSYFNLKKISKLTVKTIFYIPSSITSGSHVLTGFFNLANSIDPNCFFRTYIAKNSSGGNLITQIKKNSTLTSGVTLSYSKPAVVNHLQADITYLYDNTNATLTNKIGSYDEKFGYIQIAESSKTIAGGNIPTQNFSDRIGAMLYRSSGTTVNTTVSGNKNLYYFNLSIDNKAVTIIEPNKSNILSQNLLMIV